jgi:hypothetical protein
MALPFTVDQFLAVFTEYNKTVWPAQFVLLGLGVGLVVLSFLPRRAPARLLPLGLGLLWAWMGAVYHLGFFRRINPLATVFGVAFLLEAGLLAAWAIREPPTSFRPRHIPTGWVGGLLLAYAFLLYPRLATVFGHTYPSRPTFGLPCPTTIATLGLLLWATPTPPWWIWMIPLAWSLVGSAAAVSLGIREDFGLLVAAGSTVALLVRSRTAARSHASG